MGYVRHIHTPCKNYLAHQWWTLPGVKLLLFLYCFSLRKRSSQVQVLWEDHRNDLYINGFGAWLPTAYDPRCHPAEPVSWQAFSCPPEEARSSGVSLCHP